MLGGRGHGLLSLPGATRDTAAQTSRAVQPGLGWKGLIQLQGREPLCGRKEPGKIASGCRSGASIPLRTKASPPNQPQPCQEGKYF